jgi:glyceraldehyde 3-phosphate dehydrogenase
MTMIRIAINGYGRIGRNILRALYGGGHEREIEVVAINDLADFAVDAHLTKYDSTHGRFPGEIELRGEELVVNGHAIKLLAVRELKELPWAALNIDIVLECTGRHTKRAACEQHLAAGAKKVLLSAPGEDMDLTVVYGVNHAQLNASHRIVSNASCTTNCLAPVAKALNDAIGIRHGQMTTIHALTNDQSLIDKAHSDFYRARTAQSSIIPSSTGAARAVGQVLPELKGKLDGMALRVPTTNVSIVDLHFVPARETTAEEINAVMKAAADASGGVLKYNAEKLVSIDFNHDPASSIFDANQTRVLHGQAKVMAWYDNEWGFSNRMVDVLKVMAAAR